MFVRLTQQMQACERCLKLKISFTLLKTVHQRLNFHSAEFSAYMFTTEARTSIWNVRAPCYIYNNRCINSNHCISGQFVKTEKHKRCCDNMVMDRSQVQVHFPHQTLFIWMDVCLLYFVFSSELSADITQGHEHFNIVRIENYIRN